jgi:thiamine biosynthesis lipoprotein
VLLVVGLVVLGCGDRQSLLLEGATMGTYYRITGNCPVEVERLTGAVAGELELVNRQMSTYLPDSELTRFNESTANRWLEVSAALVEVVAAAGEISRRSSGAFDITAGPLINLWGFGPEGGIQQVPAEEEIERARRRVGYRYLEIRTDPAPALRKQRDLYVDLSAIAKGHGVDRIAAVLQAVGCPNYLVDVGGEVVGRGVNRQGQPWRVGIEVPDPAQMGAIQRIVRLQDMAVATSGDYRNFLDLGDGRYSHTIDPRSGRPVDHGLASVSVVHRSAMWADGLATALNVLGPVAGYELAVREQLAALFVVRRAEGFEERYTPAMQRYLELSQ